MAIVVEVGHEGDVASGEAMCVEVGDTSIAIFHVNGAYYAIDDTCSHEEASLSEGELVDDHIVECTAHGAQFDIRTGEVLGPPAEAPVGSYRVWVEDGVLKLEVPDVPV